MERFRMSLAKACLSFSGISDIYYDTIPDGFTMPSIYFPHADITKEKDGLNTYKQCSTIYTKVFAATTGEASGIADRITSGIMALRCRLPVYDRDWKETGEILRLEPPEMVTVDIGVVQVTMTYKIVRGYGKTEYPKSQETVINKDYD